MKRQLHTAQACALAACLLLAACGGAPQGQSSTSSSTPSSTAMPNPPSSSLPAAVPGLEGEYLVLNLEEPGYEPRTYTIVEAGDRFVVHFAAGYIGNDGATAPTLLKAYSTATGEELDSAEAPPGAEALTACQYGSYDLRLDYGDGGIAYYDSQNLAQQTTYTLPEELLQRLPGPDAPRLQFNLYDADPAAGVAAIVNTEGLWILAADGLRALRNEEVLAGLVPDLAEGAPPPFLNNVKVRNNGKTVVANIELPAGVTGQGSGGSIGALMVDIATGETHFFMDVYSWLSGGFFYTDGGATAACESSTGESIHSIDLNTYTLTTRPKPDDNYSFILGDMGSWDYETFLMLHGTLEVGGYTTFTLHTGNLAAPLLRCGNNSLGAYLRSVTQNYVFLELSSGDISYYVAARYR